MSEAKHTPGPWTIGKVNAKGQEVCIDTAIPDPLLRYSRWDGLAVAYGCDEQPELGAKVAMANARLIAAAPDLLRVAELLVSWLDEEPDAHALCDAARAAIAKATGAAS